MVTITATIGSNNLLITIKEGVGTEAVIRMPSKRK
jgi:hypothetical protein